LNNTDFFFLGEGL